MELKELIRIITSTIIIAIIIFIIIKIVTSIILKHRCLFKHPLIFIVSKKPKFVEKLIK